MGVNYGLAATTETMLYVRNLLPPGAKWAAFGIGADGLSDAGAGAAAGRSRPRRA